MPRRTLADIIAESQGAVGRGDAIGEMSLGGGGLNFMDCCCCGGGFGCFCCCSFCCGTCNMNDTTVCEGPCCSPVVGSSPSLGECCGGNPFLVGLTDCTANSPFSTGLATSGDQLCVDPCIDPAGIPSGTAEGTPCCDPLTFCDFADCCCCKGHGSAPSKGGGGSGGGMSGGGGGGGKPQQQPQNNALTTALAKMGTSISNLASGVVAESRAILGKVAPQGGIFGGAPNATGSKGDLMIVFIIVALIAGALILSGKGED